MSLLVPTLKISHGGVEVLLNLRVTASVPSQVQPPNLNKLIKEAKLIAQIRKRRFTQCGYTGKGKELPQNPICLQSFEVRLEFKYRAKGSGGKSWRRGKDII